MAPNLFVVAKKICQPQTWFQSKAPVSLSKTERLSEPAPGIYKHVPVAGWFLIAVEEGDDNAPKFRKLRTHRKVDYCRVLRRWMFLEDIETRSRDGLILNKRSQKTPLKFFLLDDEKTWVQCFSEEGKFLPGPHERFTLDEETQKFKPVKKADRPRSFGRKGSGYADSGVSSLHGKSQSTGSMSQVDLQDKSRGASLCMSGRPANSRNSTGTRPHSPSPLAGLVKDSIEESNIGKTID